MPITEEFSVFIKRWEQHQPDKIKKHERYLELRLELMTNKKDYKKWGKYGCTHILNHRVNRLGEDPDEVFKFVKEKCLKVD